MRKGIYAALGFGAGALIGWAVTADIYEAVLKRRVLEYEGMISAKTEHIWALQDRLDNPVIDDVDIIPGQISFSSKVEEILETPIEELEETTSVKETVEETTSNLQKLIDKYTSDTDAQEEFAREVAVVEGVDHTPPFVISRNTYAYDEEGQYYAKNTLTYYPDARVLLDDQDELMDNIAGDVGWRNLSRFGDESEDPNVVFIRNHRLETDFEVVKEDDESLPLHVKYGMEREEFQVNKAAGLLKLRPEDE